MLLASWFRFLWLLGLFSWGFGGHLVIVLCLIWAARCSSFVMILGGDSRSDGFGVGYLGGFSELEVRSFHGLCSSVEEEGERLGKTDGSFGLTEIDRNPRGRIVISTFFTVVGHANTWFDISVRSITTINTLFGRLVGIVSLYRIVSYYIV